MADVNPLNQVNVEIEIEWKETKIMNPIEIIQGGETSFIARFTDVATGDPLDLTNIDTLTTCFKKDDRTELTLGIGTGITIVNAVLGKIRVTLTSTQTATLALVEAATLEVTVTMLTEEPFKKQVQQAYSVIPSVC